MLLVVLPYALTLANINSTVNTKITIDMITAICYCVGEDSDKAIAESAKREGTELSCFNYN